LDRDGIFKAMKKRALLINPPIYDVQYWAEWSQPHGLLKIGKYLREKGYETYLIDCLFSDDKRLVNKKSKSVVNLCSSETEIPYSDFQKNQRIRRKVFGSCQHEESRGWIKWKRFCLDVKSL
jgi:hypothetical protein